MAACAPGGSGAAAGPGARATDLGPASDVAPEPPRAGAARGAPPVRRPGRGATTSPAPGPSGAPSPATASPAAGEPEAGGPAAGAAGTGRTRGPDLSRTAPPGPVRATPFRGSATAGKPVPPALKPAPGRAVLRIGGWSAAVIRGGQEEVDACQDAVQWAGPDIGTENGYRMRTTVIVGHDFCGFAQFGAMPVGSTVTLETTRGTWRYRVYSTYIAPGRGVPAAGLYWGDLTLQSCVGPDTGFSYLMRM
ncbi:hypothetical protein [Streptomyces sp. TS71-3]|uniref:hypothetical protein n=1 Tax=Streptomyces sp. TS71-3 TaxID=2733862 RepID=UPI001BB33AE4|nr:hypothetical protein [Streptomyces sp. TS71-3]